MVPDLWDQGFLPVSRRSVAARLPRDSPRYRAARYGESTPPPPESIIQYKNRCVRA